MIWKNIKKQLAIEFEFKDSRNLKYFSGMEIGRTKDGMIIAQRRYILDSLQETGLLGCKLALTVVKLGHKPKAR